MSDANSITTEKVTVYDIGYDSKTTTMVCGFMFLLNLLQNIDHGALPSATIALKDDLGISNVELGTLGSLVFFGLIVGSLCAAFILSNFSYRTVLSLSFLGNGVGLLSFTMTKDFSLLCFARILSGFS